MNSSRFFSILICFSLLRCSELFPAFRTRPLVSRLQAVGNLQRQQLARKTVLRARIKQIHAMHKRYMYGGTEAGAGAGAGAGKGGLNFVGKLFATTGKAGKAIGNVLTKVGTLIGGLVVTTDKNGKVELNNPFDDNWTEQEKATYRKALVDLEKLRDDDGYLGDITQLKDVPEYIRNNLDSPQIKAALEEYKKRDAVLPDPVDYGPGINVNQRRKRQQATFKPPTSPADSMTPERLANIAKVHKELHALRLVYGNLGDFTTNKHMPDSYKNLDEFCKKYLQSCFTFYEESYPIHSTSHPYGLYGTSIAGLQEPQNKQKTLDEAVKDPQNRLLGREGETLFIFEPCSYYGVEGEEYIGVAITSTPLLLDYVKKRQAKIKILPLYAGQREYEKHAKEQSLPGKVIDSALQKAMAQTHQGRGEKITANYTLEQKTIAALEALSFDTKKEFEAQYIGDHVQHHVHQLFITSLNKIGAISQVDPEVQRLLRGAVVLNKNGQAYNNHHLIKQALSAHHACDMVIDYAKTVADLSLAAGEGVLEGIRATGTFGKGVLDAVTFPEEYRPVVQEAFHKATLALSRFVAIIREDMALIARGDGAALNEFMHRREARGKEFDAFLQVLIKKYDDLTLRDKVKAVAQLFTECKSMGTLAELFAESVQLKRIAATGAVVEDILLCPRHALAEEVVHVATHVIDVEPITINAVLEVAQRDVGLVERIKKSQEAVSRQITAYFDQSLDFYRTSPGYIGIDKQPRVTQIAGLSLQAARELRLVEYLDPSVGDIKKLQEALKLFSDNKSAIVPGGPLATLLDCGVRGATSGKLGTARGAAFELERGCVLTAKGERTIIFAGKYPLIKNGKVVGIFDIDIETASKFIECKNVDWKRLSPKEINDMQSQFSRLAEIASAHGKTLELHSKYPVPETLKKWLIEKNISFMEG